MTLPREQSANDMWVDEQILKTMQAPADPEAAMGQEHRPSDEWIAVRLKVDNEVSWRARGWFRQKRWSLWRERSDEKPEGLVDWDRGDEVWMHFSPGEEVVRRRRPAWPASQQASHPVGELGAIWSRRELRGMWARLDPTKAKRGPFVNEESIRGEVIDEPQSRNKN
ncbi:predicted protein [Verticillium alfalfae VaMs.102]|uniref:Predicted protein n=1 Tax=Verticillium alfalfae (strain VaMs.102 / ATCC MYA-4576 / FGSC 10136) TaxID=526221 RepID=C9SHE1_VERA1|nr:predicted protein [Verticillium alfalfae VaMs.102]EEY17735.1 predicted protein [Verticillium alfalfae VaMs.102]